jgi:hypothetical protein
VVPAGLFVSTHSGARKKEPCTVPNSSGILHA